MLLHLTEKSTHVPALKMRLISIKKREKSGRKIKYKVWVMDGMYILHYVEMRVWQFGHSF